MANAQQSPEGATHAFDECGDIFGGGCNGSRDNNVLILSLYLIDSEDDILHLHNTNNNNVDDVKKRARLYQRLCQACNIANDILLQSSSSRSSTNNDHNNNNNNYRPWSSGGDGPIFGIHCNNTSHDIYYNNNNGMNNNNMDGDDIWQSQSPTNHHEQQQQKQQKQQQQQQQQSTTTSLSSSREEDVSTNKSDMSYDDQEQQPHLRAKYNYNNDINDLWRCISLSLQISSTLSSRHDDELKCAIEIWDNNDGHILL